MTALSLVDAKVEKNAMNTGGFVPRTTYGFSVSASSFILN
jgi:hypothetical protein